MEHNKINKKEVLIAVVFAIIGFVSLSNCLHALWIVFSLTIVIGILYLAKRFINTNNALLITLTTLYSTTVVTSVIAATKIIRFDIRVISDLFFLGEMSVPAGVIVYAVSFLITDLISEVYGKKSAISAVYLGFVSMLIFSLYSLLMVWWQPASYWTGQESFSLVVASSLRITIAGCISFLISQYWDVSIFHWLKRKKESTHKDNERKLPNLWVRNTLSTITSQFIDSTIFISIAFIGTYEDKMVINMIIAQWMIKIIIALLDTPFAYLGRNILLKDDV